MVVLIKNRQNGMEHLERHVIAITENAGYIELVYDDTYGIVSGCGYPLDTYEVVKIKSERRTK